MSTKDYIRFIPYVKKGNGFSILKEEYGFDNYRFARCKETDVRKTFTGKTYYSTYRFRDFRFKLSKFSKDYRRKTIFGEESLFL